jgi:small subunit ribosomal protein S20
VRPSPSRHQTTITQEEHFVANIKSQIKRVKTNAKRTERNRAYKSELRTWIRKFREAADSGDTGKAGDALKVASKKLDKAVSKGVIHANQAANKKSAMARKLNSIGA